MKKWEYEKHKSWGMPAEGFKGHVATAGSLVGTAGKCGACGWSVVQLDYDEELGHWYRMYCSIDAEFEVQEGGTAFFSACSKKLLDPSRCMSTTKEL